MNSHGAVLLTDCGSWGEPNLGQEGPAPPMIVQSRAKGAELAVWSPEGLQALNPYSMNES